jgi:hypothetical protein
MLEAMTGPSRIKDAVGILLLILTALLWATDVTRGAPATSCDCPDEAEDATEVSVEMAPSAPASPVSLI